MSEPNQFPGPGPDQTRPLPPPGGGQPPYQGTNPNIPISGPGGAVAGSPGGYPPPYPDQGPAGQASGPPFNQPGYGYGPGGQQNFPPQGPGGYSGYGPPPQKKNTALIGIIIAVVAVVVLGIIGFVVFSGDDDKDDDKASSQNRGPNGKNNGDSDGTGKNTAGGETITTADNYYSYQLPAGYKKFSSSNGEAPSYPTGAYSTDGLVTISSNKHTVAGDTSSADGLAQATEQFAKLSAAGGNISKVEKIKVDNHAAVVYESTTSLGVRYQAFISVEEPQTILLTVRASKAEGNTDAKKTLDHVLKTFKVGA